MNFQIINAVWGEKYINTFLQLSLPTQFSSGNLKDLTSKPNYIIYTDKAGQTQITKSPIYKTLEKHSNIIFRIIKIDKGRCPFETLLECHSDSIKEANKIGAPVVLLSPDCVLSMNVFLYLEASINKGKRLITICSARMSLEKYKQIVQEKEGISFTEKVQWSSQDLAIKTISNLHHRGKCLLMDGKKISCHPSQMYWRLDKNNLLAKSYHLHPLLIWPEVTNVYPLLSADGKNFLERICPNKNHWEVIKDCSEVSLFEISSDEQFTSDLKVHVNSFWFRMWVNENTSDAHHHFINHDIILGDSIPKPEWEKKISDANKFLKRLLKVNYSQKLYHSKLMNKLSQHYYSSLFPKINKDFFKWHFMLVIYVLTGKKKLTWKKFKHHFFYLFKYKNFPINSLRINTNNSKNRERKLNAK